MGNGLCCGVSSMMSCNENSRALRLQRFDEVKATGAEIMLIVPGAWSLRMLEIRGRSKA